MSVIRCMVNYPYPVFRTPGELLGFTGELRRWDFIAVQRHQVAPIVETAVRKAMREEPQNFSIANASTVGLGQILWQRVNDRARELSVEALDPHRVFVRYLAYNRKEVESFLSCQKEQWDAPHKHREAIPRLLPGIDRVMTVSLVDATANFVDPELDAAIRGALGSGHPSSRIGDIYLEEDYGFDWGHLYAFECVLDEQASVKEFHAQGAERDLIVETWR